MEEEISILGPTLLERPRGPLFDRRDARDEEPLREPARLLGHVWEDKRYTGGMGGPATFAQKDGMPPKQYEGPASYALTKEEKEIFFECLLSMKVPSGFSSNIKGTINMAEKKFQNLKSHDCHVIMTQLLPVALKGLLPENVRLAIVKLCAFLNAISQKVIDPQIIPMSC